MEFDVIYPNLLIRERLITIATIRQSFNTC